MQVGGTKRPMWLELNEAEGAGDVVSKVCGTHSGTQLRSLALVLRAAESQKGVDPT